MSDLAWSEKIFRDKREHLVVNSVLGYGEGLTVTAGTRKLELHKMDVCRSRYCVLKVAPIVTPETPPDGAQENDRYTVLELQHKREPAVPVAYVTAPPSSKFPAQLQDTF
eukprot:4044737-Amphidinium_carterae.1